MSSKNDNIFPTWTFTGFSTTQTNQEWEKGILQDQQNKTKLLVNDGCLNGKIDIRRIRANNPSLSLWWAKPEPQVGILRERNPEHGTDTFRRTRNDPKSEHDALHSLTAATGYSAPPSGTLWRCSATKNGRSDSNTPIRRRRVWTKPIREATGASRNNLISVDWFLFALQPSVEKLMETEATWSRKGELARERVWTDKTKRLHCESMWRSTQNRAWVIKNISTRSQGSWCCSLWRRGGNHVGEVRISFCTECVCGSVRPAAPSGGVPLFL